MYSIRKNISSLIRIIVLSFVAAILCLSLYQCNSPRPDSEKRVALSKQHEEDRNQMRSEFRMLMMSIDKELGKVDRKLADTKIDNEESLLDADRKLKSSKAKVEKALSDIDLANEKNWKEVKALTRETVSNVQFSVRQLTYDVGKLMADETK